MINRISILDVQEFKNNGEKFPMLTAYDYTTSKLIDQVGVPIILVGDSLGQVVLGYDSTIPVTVDEMIYHTKAVVRGSERSLIVSDMPFMSYNISLEQTLHNAARFVQEAGANALKLEGGKAITDKVKRIVECGIPVMGHLGLTPQSVNQLGGYKLQGKTFDTAEQILEDAIALEEAGAFSIVLEVVPEPLAKLITEHISIPTIGIGAGKFCDGQVQVYHDLLGLFIDFYPKHAKRYGKLADSIKESVEAYSNEVRSGEFPTDKQSYQMDPKILSEILKDKLP